MLSIAFLFLFVLFINTSNCYNINNSEVTTMSTTTTTIGNKDKEVENVLKVRDDYTLYHVHGYYKYNKNKATWNQARDICVKEGAHLVVINSQTEADLLAGIMKTNIVGGIAAGFYRSSTNSEFLTVLGGQVSDTGHNKWQPGYPRTNSGWDCGYIRYDGTLYNHLCTNKYHFICKI